MTDQMTTRPGTTSAPLSPAGGRPWSRPWVRPAAVAVVLLLMAALPYLDVQIPVLFDGPFTSPGVLHLLSLMCVMAAVAVTYDLLFGFTGLLSFGHGLYIAIGMYGTAVLLTTTDLGLGGVIGYVVVLGLVVPLLLGAVCLRVSGIAFAMATLAFAQAGAIFVVRDPFRVTGGELGLALPYERLPELLVGVVNARYRYWLALALLVLTFAVVRWALASRPGRVWRAIRDNETRVTVLGLRPYAFKLMAFTLSSFLATLAGAVYALIVGGAHAEVTDATFTLGLLVMVVLGGSGRLYGGLIGGLLYTYLNHRLGDLSTVLGGPLSEPLFVLGVLFVILIMFLPGGIASLVRRTARQGGS